MPHCGHVSAFAELGACKVIEHVFERLITWAAAAIETWSNQPVLPHAIIVPTALDDAIDETVSDVVANIESILQGCANTINRNKTFEKLAQMLAGMQHTDTQLDRSDPLVLFLVVGKSVVLPSQIPSTSNTASDLRITQERPKIMQEQMAKLHGSTVTACTASRTLFTKICCLSSFFSPILPPRAACFTAIRPVFVVSLDGPRCNYLVVSKSLPDLHSVEFHTVRSSDRTSKHLANS
ncbi:hypothetical protein BD289DRAFT_196452 [Coniella lustricola]|uniref:Uncharacterized protein n=1 Tax=Coniella lustricola TaxID=2025994 RepID=A0A2T3ACS3_9PEZI|nr:hypothetical protein BD289DRAFT_196452 [Coniella lustricola]